MSETRLTREERKIAVRAETVGYELSVVGKKYILTPIVTRHHFYDMTSVERFVAEKETQTREE